MSGLRSLGSRKLLQTNDLKIIQKPPPTYYNIGNGAILPRFTKIKQEIVLNTKNFTYKNANTDKTPNVMVTSENQHQLRGFNMNYAPKTTQKRIVKEWNKIKNQPWSNTTKERVVIRRVGRFAKMSFRAYKKESIGKYLEN